MPFLDPFAAAERHIQATLARLPKFLSRFLGYRGEKPASSPLWVSCLWGFMGAFGGMAILFAIYGHTEHFSDRDVLPIIASYAASAVLCYGAIDSPLAQPRALIFGHFFSALVGIIMAKIFDFDLQKDDAPNLQWLAASLAVAISLVVMEVTKTTHPPAGATALLPVLDPNICALRWYLLPVVLLSSALVLVSALLLNNVQGRYPRFWITDIPVEEKEKEGARFMQHRHRTPNTPEENMREQRPQRRHSLRDLESGRNQPLP